MAMESDDKYLRPRYLSVLERLETAVCHSGRRKEDVTLVAVSKLHPASMVAAVCDLGQIDFGENYVQEAMEKRAEIEAMDRPRTIRWHMIGHVQSRKASIVAGAFDLIHSLDSIRLATALEKHCAGKNAKQKVLIEVNVGEEPQKTGVEMKDLDGLAAYVIEKCPHLELQGLMCMPEPRPGRILPGCVNSGTNCLRLPGSHCRIFPWGCRAILNGPLRREPHLSAWVRISSAPVPQKNPNFY